MPLWYRRLFCPYHLAMLHVDWLASVGISPGHDGPLFPTITLKHPSKANVVKTFEALGTCMGQPLVDNNGLRLFGGHTPRVTGARWLARLGIEVNKIRILARHTGDTILRYVAEAPLESLRSDLGLGRNDGGATKLGRLNLGSSGATSSAATTLRMQKLEDAVARLDTVVAAQALELATLKAGFNRMTAPTYIQNVTSAIVHKARATQDGRAVCGWHYTGQTYRTKRSNKHEAILTLKSLDGIPCSLLCERCLTA